MSQQRMPLTAIRSAVRPGQVYDVTNHHVTREDHPAFGTTRRAVTRITGSRFYLSARPPGTGETPVD